jgi:hypothetical protein
VHCGYSLFAFPWQILFIKKEENKKRAKKAYVKK